MGNLRTAWYSHELAKLQGQPWVLRFEDIDTARVIPGAIEQQKLDLERCGLISDQTYIQSENRMLHLEVLKWAVTQGEVYPCTCSRAQVKTELAQMASAPNGGLQKCMRNTVGDTVRDVSIDPVVRGRSERTQGTASAMELPVQEVLYSGHCRLHQVDLGAISRNYGHSIGWRLKRANVGGGVGEGDILVARTRVGEDGIFDSFLPAYHFACGIDDAEQKIQTIVRAWDLESAVGVQRDVMRVYFKMRQMPPLFPEVVHTALVVKDDGTRLEKRTHGITLEEWINAGHSVKELCDLFRASVNFGCVEPRQISLGSLLTSLDVAHKPQSE